MSEENEKTEHGLAGHTAGGLSCRALRAQQQESKHRTTEEELQMEISTAEMLHIRKAAKTLTPTRVRPPLLPDGRVQDAGGDAAPGLSGSRWEDNARPLGKTVGLFLTKLNILFLCNPTIGPLRPTQRRQTFLPTQKGARDVYSSFSHNCPNLAAPEMPFER